MRKKNMMKSSNFSLFLLYTVQREDAHRYSHNLKLKQKIGAKRPKNLIYLKSTKVKNVKYIFDQKTRRKLQICDVN